MAKQTKSSEERIRLPGGSGRAARRSQNRCLEQAVGPVLDAEDFVVVLESERLEVDDEMVPVGQRHARLDNLRAVLDYGRGHGIEGVLLRIGGYNVRVAAGHVDVLEVAGEHDANGQVEKLVAISAARDDHHPHRSLTRPSSPDVTLTQIHFADTSDRVAGPFGAKPMSESPFNPVAPALSNGVRDATGMRSTILPLTRDRIFLDLARAAATGASP